MGSSRWIPQRPVEHYVLIGNSSSPDHRSTRVLHHHGFTLVELLVVIGIVALLISILMPALNKARQASLQIACASNMRQLGQAMVLYCADNKNWFPPNVLVPAAPGDFWWPSRVYKYLNRNIEVFRCPAASEEEVIRGYGTWVEASQGLPYRQFPLCYGANIYVGQDMNVGWKAIKVTQITRAPETVWLIDSQQYPFDAVNGSPNTADFNSHPLDATPYCSYRHSKHINVLFVDGHVTAYPLAPQPTDPGAIGNLLKWNPWPGWNPW